MQAITSYSIFRKGTKALTQVGCFAGVTFHMDCETDRAEDQKQELWGTAYTQLFSTARGQQSVVFWLAVKAGSSEHLL